MSAPWWSKAAHPWQPVASGPCFLEKPRNQLLMSSLIWLPGPLVINVSRGMGRGNFRELETTLCKVPMLLRSDVGMLVTLGEMLCLGQKSVVNSASNRKSPPPPPPRTKSCPWHPQCACPHFHLMWAHCAMSYLFLVMSLFFDGGNFLSLSNWLAAGRNLQNWGIPSSLIVEWQP